MEATDRRTAAVQERLEADLSGYKNNMIKESIRMGHHELVSAGAYSSCHTTRRHGRITNPCGVVKSSSLQ